MQKNTQKKKDTKEKKIQKKKEKRKKMQKEKKRDDDFHEIWHEAEARIMRPAYIMPV